MTHYGEKLSAQLGVKLAQDFAHRRITESVENKFRTKLITENILTSVLKAVNNQNAPSGSNQFQYRDAPPKVLTGQNYIQGRAPRRKDNILSPYEDPDSSLNQQQQNVIRKMNRNFAKGEQRTYEQIETIALMNSAQDVVIGEETIRVTPMMARNLIKLYETINEKNKKVMKARLCESSESFYKLLDFAVKKT